MPPQPEVTAAAEAAETLVSWLRPRVRILLTWPGAFAVRVSKPWVGLDYGALVMYYGTIWFILGVGVWGVLLLIKWLWLERCVNIGQDNLGQISIALNTFCAIIWRLLVGKPISLRLCLLIRTIINRFCPNITTASWVKVLRKIKGRFN